MIPRELRTERLLLRQWRDGDAAALDEIYRDPEFLEPRCSEVCWPRL